MLALRIHRSCSESSRRKSCAGSSPVAPSPNTEVADLQLRSFGDFVGTKAGFEALTLRSSRHGLGRISVGGFEGRVVGFLKAIRPLASWSSARLLPRYALSHHEGRRASVTLTP